ncbi:MAG TPA: 3'-5' exonuclease, partial [Actinotalea sp.]|nr:3'-5' exonuclease [Actinotalea sp.]
APPAARGAVRERWDALAALVQLADDLAERGARQEAGTPAPTLVTLVAELEERAAAQHAPAVDGVTLASLHAAKGLEWDAVFLVGMSEGLMPISLAETEAALAEERRLLYVGVTRAREHLHLSHARARNPGGRAGRRRSRFLDGIWPDEPGSRGPGPGSGRGRDPRPAPDDLADVDPELLAGLRAWRSQVAAETDKPAFTVLLDGPLTDVARTRPASVADLARIRGIGPAKIDRYGQALLAIVAGHRVP